MNPEEQNVLEQWRKRAEMAEYHVEILKAQLEILQQTIVAMVRKKDDQD